MRLTDILQPDCVQVPLDAESKEQAIDQLVDLLCEKLGLDQIENLRQAVWERETTRTTGIGHGIAIPHGKCDDVKELCMAVGRVKEPLEFGAVDNKPVDLILLLASPADQTGPHIQALARISRMLTDESFRTTLKSASDGDELYQMIAQHEQEAAV